MIFDNWNTEPPPPQMSYGLALQEHNTAQYYKDKFKKLQDEIDELKALLKKASDK